jgi:uncharacterized protein YdeI (YjbR/CyaY-like superfamily)
MADYDAKKDVPQELQRAFEAQQNRQNAYFEELGNWQDQLDMIFHDIDAWRSRSS